jgi:YNFM family putative membrane transporter
LAPPYDLSQTQVALIFFAYAFGAGGSTIIGGLTERYGRAHLITLSVVTMILGILITLLKPLAAIVIGIIILTIGFFAAHALASAWVGVRVPVARAQASSLYLLAYYLGSSISGTGGGYVWSAWGWSGIVGLVVILLGIAVVTIRVLIGIERRNCSCVVTS